MREARGGGPEERGEQGRAVGGRRGVEAGGAEAPSPPCPVAAVAAVVAVAAPAAAASAASAAGAGAAAAVPSPSAAPFRHQRPRPGQGPRPRRRGSQGCCIGSGGSSGGGGGGGRRRRGSSCRRRCGSLPSSLPSPLDDARPEARKRSSGGSSSGRVGVLVTPSEFLQAQPRAQAAALVRKEERGHAPSAQVAVAITFRDFVCVCVCVFEGGNRTRATVRNSSPFLSPPPPRISPYGPLPSAVWICGSVSTSPTPWMSTTIASPPVASNVKWEKQRGVSLLDSST